MRSRHPKFKNDSVCEALHMSTNEQAWHVVSNASYARQYAGIQFKAANRCSSRAKYVRNGAIRVIKAA
jgi:hypothetical protein